jgi:V/A-type H+-transporting ATPase subunit C
MLISRPVRFGAVNARCRALKSTLLERDFYERALTAATVGDLHGMLRESAYAPYVGEAEKEGLERGIDRAFSKLYTRSTAMLKQKERAVFDLFFLERKAMPGRKARLAGGQSGAEIFKRADLAYIEAIKTALGRLGRGEREDLKEIIGSYFDLLNLYTVVRLRVLYRMEPEEILPFLVPYGSGFDMKTLGAAAGLATLADISSLFHERFGEAFGSYHAFRRVIHRYHMATLRKAWLGYPFKISVIFSLLRLKEIETENLKALAEGIHYRLPADEIETMLVGVG